MCLAGEASSPRPSGPKTDDRGTASFRGRTNWGSAAPGRLDAPSAPRPSARQISGASRSLGCAPALSGKVSVGYDTPFRVSLRRDVMARTSPGTLPQRQQSTEEQTSNEPRHERPQEGLPK